jgi:ADP-dependent phosphofructokinase/glucokinase
LEDARKIANMVTRKINITEAAKMIGVDRTELAHALPKCGIDAGTSHSLTNDDLERVFVHLKSYAIVPTRRARDALGNEQVEAAMLAAGAVILEGKSRLRFATKDEADAALDRLAQEHGDEYFALGEETNQ